jgi:phospholipid/cholesterol/gamma-HCH transport system substrate-binding protein
VIKQAPSVARILGMVAFALSCVGILIFLWLAFGGPLPLRPEGYRLRVAIPEAATLAQEADVRMAGVNIGKVKTKALEPGGRRTLVVIELNKRFAPIPRDTKAILRQKTLLGETYVELSPGHRAAGMLPDGGRLADSSVKPTVELDEIFNTFDPTTRQAVKRWLRELDRAVRPSHGRDPAEDLNDALGNLGGFAVDGARLFEVLDEQDGAVHRLIRNTGEVTGALTRRTGALRALVQSAGETFAATASRDEALAQTFQILPTFLDESRVTLARLEGFAHRTRPLVRDLKRPATDLGPTLHDLGSLSPDLRRLFRDLDPLIDASRKGLPATAGIVRGLAPVLDSLHTALAELNPILSFLNFNQRIIGGFFTDGLSNLARGVSPDEPWSTQALVLDTRSFKGRTSRPPWDRGNGYPAPNVYERTIGLGAIESFTCPGGKDIPHQVDTGAPGGIEVATPCFIQPPSLFQGQQFPRLVKGKAPIVPAPQGRAGTRPASR